VDEDMCTAALGMETFWLDTWPLNRKDKPTGGIERGGFERLLAKIDALPSVK